MKSSVMSIPLSVWWGDASPPVSAPLLRPFSENGLCEYKKNAVNYWSWPLCRWYHKVSLLFGGACRVGI